MQSSIQSSIQPSTQPSIQSSTQSSIQLSTPPLPLHRHLPLDQIRHAVRAAGVAESVDRGFPFLPERPVAGEGLGDDRARGFSSEPVGAGVMLGDEASVAGFLAGDDLRDDHRHAGRDAFMRGGAAGLADDEVA